MNEKVGAAALIGLGVLFLLGQMFSMDIFGLGWPLFVMLPGLAFLFFAIRGDANAAPLAVPGAIVTGTGAILFYQNFTGHWESWAYAWALYPVFLGLALTFMGERTRNQKIVEAEITARLRAVPDLRVYKVNERGDRELSIAMLSNNPETLSAGVAQMEAAMRRVPVGSRVSEA